MRASLGISAAREPTSAIETTKTMERRSKPTYFRKLERGLFTAFVAALCLATTSVLAEPPTTPLDARALARLTDPPLGLPPVPGIDNGLPTAAEIALGRKLLFDRRLSHVGTMSCAMCHIPEQGFTNNELKTPVGVFGLSIRRNAPTLLNVAYQETLFHDGRETGLETQVISPLLARNEMANPSIGYLIERIDSFADYDGLFEITYGEDPSIEGLGRALAAYQRSLLSGNSAFDRWRFGGEAEALGPAAQAGFALFTGKAGCVNCHTIGEASALFTDQAFHFTGIGHRRPADDAPVPVEIAPGVVVPLARQAVEAVSGPQEPDLGRYEVSLDPDDLWRFKTPSLRNVALTAPYMHDGSLGSLRAVVAFYDDPPVEHEQLDPLLAPLGLSEAEIDQLVAFLESLTGDNIAELIADARSVGVGN